MGFSGGVKSAVIGLGGRETITANHHMLLNPAANLGSFETNPMRMDIEEIGRIIDIDFALNVVLDDEKRIINVFFGTPAEVIEKGVAYSRKACLVDAPANYDLVICSAGGFPKDINLYQSQKAITHAGGFLRDGGAIILTAECRTGFGSKPFQQFIEANLSAEKIIHEFQNMPFAIGPHKAYQLAVQARDFRLLLVSTIEPNPGLHSLLYQTASVQEALEICTTFLSPSARIAILPYATHVIHHHESRS
jgi:nickel-dependent lactate racemase